MTGAISSVSLTSQPGDLDVRHFGDSLVVYDVDTRRTIALQPPASTLLTALLQGDHTVSRSALPDNLANEASDRFQAAVAELKNAGLITVHDG